VNRANDSHACRGASNNGTYEQNVRSQSLGTDVQAAHDPTNEQYGLAEDIIDAGGAAADAQTQTKFSSVVDESEGAYTGATADPTGGATFWDHRRNSIRSSSMPNCRPTVSTTIDGADFYRCTR